jgi:mannose-6-phosphate isomerase-like protein (cupin superfamily)
VKPGDVVVVPNGLPHQFVDVKGPFDYLAIKVRSAE